MANLDRHSEIPVVLVVDDEAPVLETTAAILSENFRVLTAQDGAAALELLGKNLVDVVCTDYRMPGMNGIELLRQAAQRAHGISGVVVTGYRELISSEERRSDSPFLILVKPYAPEKLLAMVGQAAQFTRLKRSLVRPGSHP